MRMKMRDIIDLVEAVHPPVLTMYHGTSDTAAKQIAQLGFVPDPEARSYTDDDEDLKALPGSYFTNDLSVAMRYAHRAAEEWAGAPAIVVANISLTDAVPDEDVIQPAFREALKAKTADAFVKKFHDELVGGYEQKIPVARDAMLAMRRAWTAYQKAGDDYEDNQAAYREQLDRVCRAYARMAFETSPRYLGGHAGHHTVRLPQGLGVEHIVSITVFNFGGMESPDGVYVENVTAILGRPLSVAALDHAADTLWQQGDIGVSDDSADDNAAAHVPAPPKKLPDEAEARKMLFTWAVKAYPDRTAPEIQARIDSLGLSTVYDLLGNNGLI
jgi:hypothetical protein